jgi:hypothetical protein
MRIRIVILTALLLAAVQTFADSKTERHWGKCARFSGLRTEMMLAVTIGNM